MHALRRVCLFPHAVSAVGERAVFELCLGKSCADHGWLGSLMQGGSTVLAGSAVWLPLPLLCWCVLAVLSGVPVGRQAHLHVLLTRACGQVTFFGLQEWAPAAAVVLCCGCLSCCGGGVGG
jgi:hypothetical protein